MTHPKDAWFAQARDPGPDEDPKTRWFRLSGLRDQLNTATGRAMFLRQYAPSKAKSMVFELMDGHSNLSIEEEERYKELIDKLDTPDRPGILGTAEDLGRGFVAGAASIPTQIADLALGVVDVTNRAVGNPDNMARDMRNTVQEATASIREEFDPRGTAGTIGEVAGGMVVGALPYGSAARLSGVGLTKLAPASGVARAITAATGPTATIGQRVAANVATGVPINALQAATLDDATMQDKLKSFAVGTGADVLFGLGEHGYQAWRNLKTKEGIPVTDKDVPVGAPANKNAKEIEELYATSQAKAAEKAADDAARRALGQDMARAARTAKAEYLKENPSGVWRDLPKQDREARIRTVMVRTPDQYKSAGAQDIITKMRAEQGIAAPTNTNPNEPQTQEVPAPVTDPTTETLVVQGPADTQNPQLPTNPVVEVAPTPPQELKTVTLDRPIVDLVRLPEKEAKAVFKQLKLPWIDGDSPMDNLKEAVRRVLAGDPTNQAARADEDMLGQITNQLSKRVVEPVKLDPASPAGIIKQTNKTQTPLPDDIPLDPQVLLDPKLARKWATSPLSVRTPEELHKLHVWLDDKITSLPTGENDVYLNIQHQLLEEVAKRGDPSILASANDPGRVSGSVYDSEGGAWMTTRVHDAIKNRSFLVETFDGKTVNFSFSDSYSPKLRETLAQLSAKPIVKTYATLLDRLHNDLFRQLDIRTRIPYDGEFVGFAAVDGANRGRVHSIGGFVLPETNYLRTLVRSQNNAHGVMYSPFAAFRAVNLETALDRFWGIVVHEATHVENPYYNLDITLPFEQALTRNIGDTWSVWQKHRESFRGLFDAIRRDSSYNDAWNLLVDEINLDARIRIGTDVRRNPDSSNPETGLHPSAESGTAAEVPGTESVQPVQTSSGSTQSGGNGGNPVRPTRTGREGARGAVKGGVSGFVFGVMGTDSDDPDRAAKVLMATAVGAGAGWVGGRVWSKLTTPRTSSATIIPNSESVANKIIGVDELVTTNDSMMGKLRAFYTGTVRSTFGVDRFINAFEAIRELPTQLNAAKLMQTWGRHVAMTESWLTHGPTYVSPKGEVVRLLDDDGLPVMPLQHILVDTAQGHKKALDSVLVARTSLELLAKGKKAPISAEQARQVLLNAPQFLHDAASQLRQYHKALLRVLVASGRLSQEGFDKMTEELWYAPLQRIVGVDLELANAIKKTKHTKTPTGIHERSESGSNAPVLSPYDASVEMTARILRSAEFNTIVNTLWQNSRMMPADVGNLMIRKGENRTNVVAQRVAVKAAKLRAEMKISEADAAGIASFLDIDTVKIDSGGEVKHMITGYNNGETVTYVVDPLVYDGFKAMSNQELDILWRVLGAPARLASGLVVNNPVFVATQAFVDTFHNTLTSEYGFRPFVDSIRAWWLTMTGDPRIQQLMDAGGPGTVQSLRYTGDLKKAVQAVATAGRTPLETAIHQFKELHPYEALKTLMHPLASAGRVGEYLRALDHGESVLEATYAAWNVGGNVKLQGAAPSMRAINMLAMFLRPAISALDETYYRTGLPHPRRNKTIDAAQAAKFALLGSSIVMPSALLWWANKDDEEITQLRRTESGQRYWWFRNWNNEIMRMRKPHVIGQLFGTTTENVLDKMWGDNPDGVTSWLGGMANDAALNLVPLIGVVPMAIAANRNPVAGGALVPQGQAALEPTLWGYDNGSWPARVVGDNLQQKLAGKFMPDAIERALSPAAFDLTVRTLGGMWGEDALRAASYAHEWVKHNQVPPNSELPLVGRFFAKENTASLASIREFYRYVDQVDRAANTVARFTESDPEKLGTYIPKVLPQLSIAPVFSEARGNITQLWKAVNDVRGMPDDMITPQTKRMLEATYIKQIQSHAHMANVIARAAFKQ